MTGNQKMWVIIVAAVILNLPMYASSYKEYKLRLHEIELNTVKIKQQNEILAEVVRRLADKLQSSDSTETLDDVLAARPPVEI